MKNVSRWIAVAVLMMSAVAAFAQTPVRREPPKGQDPAPRYEVRSGRVFYGNVVVQDADIRSFVDLGYGYAKDKGKVWWEGRLLPYVDAMSFRLNVHQGPGNGPGVGPGTPGGPGNGPGYGPGNGPGGPGYGQGGPSGPGTPGGPGYGPGPDGPRNYGTYSIKGNTVYYNGTKVKDARASSFKNLGWGYAKDTFDVYYCGKEIDASSTSFKVLEDGYAKDSFDVFYRGKEVKGASPSSFKVLGGGYAKDAFDIYYRGVEVD